MTDIKKILKHEYEVLSKQYTVLGVFLCGSQNYGLAAEDSDVDTKAVIVPSLNDLILASPVSRTIRFDCGECDVKDVREMVKNVKKQNVNFVETLFTDYHYISPSFRRMLTKTEKTAADIEQYGYHRKSLMNTFKAAAMLDKYVAGDKYESVLDCSKYAQIRTAAFPAPKAAKIAAEMVKRAKAAADTYIKERNPETDAVISAWLDEWLCDLIRGCVAY